MLEKASGEFDGIITFRKKGWSETLTVKFLRSAKQGVWFASVKPGDTRTGYLSKTAILGNVRVTLYEGE
ncbi:MAG TPA: hypothetical protein VFZ48_03970 [Candidatus Saccharimonadales bacterium]